MNNAVIGLGSNIDAAANMNRSVELLKEQFSVLKVSQWMQTQPIGITDQPIFFNGALMLETTLELKALNSKLKDIEDQMGRNRSRPKFGPREIDLDVILWNGEVVDEDYYTRDFLQVLVKKVL